MGAQRFGYCRPHYTYLYELRAPVISSYSIFALLPYVCLAVVLLGILIQ